ncbi:hypothetical protein F5Y04DRAFT_243033 [Hypomontagnella monticulosa]|nr:hypothetical protein F5Y04DRAFT_243033 [Hypomontagnella monticulosa]
MKPLQLGLISTLTLPLALGAVRRDLQRRNVEVAQIDESDRIDRERQAILFHPADSDFEDIFRCTPTTGKHLTLNRDGTFAACCAPGQRLLGTPETAFDCCADGHELVGSYHTGYQCCPRGQSYDGVRCGSLCRNGKVMIDGECVCPRGTVAAADGTCKRPVGCDSGIITGKCYVFKMENGRTFGYDTGQSYYSAADHSNQHRLGKFKLCKNEGCTVGSSVDPDDAIHIKDTQGTLLRSSETQSDQWLNKASDGNHIGRTPRYNEAGAFTITKWSCGKYCLGGSEHGVSYACPSDTPSITFTVDKQACTPLEIIEVPCDIRAVDNNCMWEKTAGSCGPGGSNSCHCPKS